MHQVMTSLTSVAVVDRRTRYARSDSIFSTLFGLDNTNASIPLIQPNARLLFKSNPTLNPTSDRGRGRVFGLAVPMLDKRSPKVSDWSGIQAPLSLFLAQQGIPVQENRGER
jgi:hypothetical protein